VPFAEAALAFAATKVLDHVAAQALDAGSSRARDVRAVERLMPALQAAVAAPAVPGATR
jgi:hypothetical protein